jgi:hypothetical protein
MLRNSAKIQTVSTARFIRALLLAAVLADRPAGIEAGTASKLA